MNDPGVDGQRKRAVGSAQKRRAISPITRRILAVNVLALAVLVLGLLYVGEYRDGLIESETGALASQAELVAGALGEAAVTGGENEDHHLVEDVARQIVRRLATTTHTRARLFAPDGKLVTDSRMLVGPGGSVQVETLPPPGEKGSLTRYVLGIFDRIGALLQKPAPPFPRPQNGLDGKLLPEVTRAFEGEIGSALRTDPTGQTVLSVAVPVQRYKRIIGAIMLSKDTRLIEQAVYEVRLDILKVFAFALAVTVLLSIYLAGTIARPVHRLAEAAERIRRGLGRQSTIPDFTERNDEIGELSGALRDMTEALWQRMDAIEQFAADVAHEIKNPLSSLQSAVETIARLEDPEQQKKLLQIVREDVARLDRLISDISSASRVDAELSRAEMMPVDIADLVATLIGFLRDSGDSEKVRLEFDREHDAPIYVAGLEDRLMQVFRNLFSNAISFSPAGGLIRVAITASMGWVEITVDDDGPGIPAGAEMSIFERFYRERPADEKFGTHSGLGLSISKQIIDAHRGTIQATNRVGPDGKTLGARFIVRLPAMA